MSNYTIPQRMLNAAICAYSVEGDQASKITFNPDKKYLDPLDLESTPKLFYGGKYDIDAGFIATTKADPISKDKWVILSFRGTLSSYIHDDWRSFKAFLDDWIQDDETRMTTMLIKDEKIGSVAQGFYNAMEIVWKLIQPELDKVNWEEVSGIQITGHSKGAAMTFLAAAMVKAHYPQAKSVNVHAFAAPLAGDPAFAKWYKSQNLEVTTTRYQREHDIVPFLPPPLSWNLFKHLPLTWHPKGILLEIILFLLSRQIHTGFKELGSLVALASTSYSESIVPKADEKYLQQAIRSAISNGHGDTIAGAHSAINSYWPALFHSDSSDSSKA